MWFILCDAGLVRKNFTEDVGLQLGFEGFGSIEQEKGGQSRKGKNYVYIYVYMCVYAHICMCINTHIYKTIYIKCYMYAYINTNIYGGGN